MFVVVKFLHTTPGLKEDTPKDEARVIRAAAVKKEMASLKLVSSLRNLDGSRIRHDHRSTGQHRDRSW